MTTDEIKAALERANVDGHMYKAGNRMIEALASDLLQAREALALAEEHIRAVPDCSLESAHDQPCNCREGHVLRTIRAALEGK